MMFIGGLDIDKRCYSNGGVRLYFDGEREIEKSCNICDLVFYNGVKNCTYNIDPEKSMFKVSV